MSEPCTKSAIITDISNRLLVVETKQDGMEKNIEEIKESQKESRTLVMGTLITSVLTLIGILFQFVR